MANFRKMQGFPIVLAVAIGTFMGSLDSSVVNVTLPVIQSHFHVPLLTVEWVVVAYLLVVSGLLLTFGRMADLYGHKKIYLMGFGTFTAGSLFCGCAAGIGMLIGARVFQALGAGLMFATGPAIITNAVRPENRGQALSLSAIAVAVSLCTGPVLGGFLAAAFGWRSVFFINLPIGIFGMWRAWKIIPADQPQTAVPFDRLGSVLIFLALTLLLLPLDLAGRHVENAPAFFGMLAGGILITGVFIVWEQRAKHPLLNIALFRNRTFAAANLGTVLNFMAQFVMVFLAPFYLEHLRGFSPALAGLLFIPMPLATLLAAPVSGTLSDRFDGRYLRAAGMGVMATGLFWLSHLTAHTPLPVISMGMAVTGLGSGLFQTPNNSAIMGSVPARNRGTAGGALATMRNLGMVLGVAISGALFSLNTARAHAFHAARGLTGLPLEQRSFTDALHLTFIIAGSFALLAMAVSLVKELRTTAAPVHDVNA